MIAKYIDHTCLDPFSTQATIITLCADAMKYGFRAVCIHPYYIPFVKHILGYEVRIATVVGFPFGCCSTESKIADISWVAKAGADEVDIVMNITAFKSGHHDAVVRDISSAVYEAKNKNLEPKVIVEANQLSDQGKTEVISILREAGVKFVKTATGFLDKSPPKVEDIKLFKQSGLLVKASGGIATYDCAIKLIEAGADRLGTSHSVEIVKGSPDVIC